VDETLAPPGATDRKSAMILDAVVRLIEERGYGAVEVRPVAQAAPCSLETIYRKFPSRDAMVAAAVERWIRTHMFRPLRHPDPSASVSDRLVGVFRQLFDPFVEHPRMLEAAVRVQQRAGGTPDVFGGATAVGPFLLECFDENTDRADVAEIMLLIGHIAYSVVSQVAMGTMTADHVLSVFESAARRLTATITSPAPAARRRGR
jgi:AcrR family transcriptional regulator